jgi:hypothetical protein
MADNVSITQGAGTTVATDELAGSVHIQRVKAAWGPGGTANDADVASGMPLPVQVRSHTGLIPVGEPTDAKNPATDGTSVSLISLTKQVSAYLKTLVDTALSGEYETVAASQTNQVLGPTGATGDYIAGVLIIPETVNPGNVILLDNAISIIIFAGGATSVSSLVPFFVPLGLISVSGSWRLTTGADVHCVAMGNFT